MIIYLIMDAFYKNPFKKFVKKQNRPFQLVIEDEVETIFRGEVADELKKGDLTGFQVHKFKFKGQKYLIAYQIQGTDIIFYMIGTHENFYRDLKLYIK